MSIPVFASSAAAHDQETEPIRVSSAVRSRRPAMERVQAKWVIGFPLTVAFVHFLIVQITATLAYRYGTPTGSSEPAGHPPVALSGFASNLVEPLRLWDGLWYRLVAQEGYESWAPKAAFWPIFPRSMGFLSDVTGVAPDYIGYLIANISFAFALILLYRLITIDFDQNVARRSLWAIALFPTSLFFSAVYTESLFLLTSVAALLLARTNRWWLAGLVSVLAALTRSYGVFLILPFAVLWFKQYGLYIRDLFPKGLTILMPLLGPLIFAVMLSQTDFNTRQPGTQGNWKEFVEVQSEWYRTFAWPWETMRCAIDGCELTVNSIDHYSPEGNPVKKSHPEQVGGADWTWFSQLREDPSWSLVTSEQWRKNIANSDTLELVVTVAFLFIALIGLKLLPLYQSAWLIPSLVVPLFSPSTVHPLMSMPRFVVVMFPAFVVIALILRRRWFAFPFAVISTLLLIFYTAQFANWFWVS